MEGEREREREGEKERERERKRERGRERERERKREREREREREKEKERERERPERDNGIRSNIPGYGIFGSPSIDVFIFFLPVLVRFYFCFSYRTMLLYFLVRYCLPPHPVL